MAGPVASADPTARQRRKPSNRIQSLNRALDLVEALARQGTAGLPLQALSRAVALHPSTAHTILGTLLSRGYVQQDPESGHYRLGAASLTLAQQFMHQCDLAQLAMPLVRRLHRQFDELVVLGVLQGGRQHSLISLRSSRPLVSNEGHEQAGSLHCTAVGKVLLSGSDRADVDAILEHQGLTAFTPYTLTTLHQVQAAIRTVQTIGYAVVRQEHHVGLLGVAAPVRDATGRVIAGLGLAIPTMRVDEEREQVVVEAVQETAFAVSRQLGFTPPGPS